MLDVVKGSGMLDICAVVVRYFGGIKLGAGGLVHAYGGAVSETMEKVEAVTRARRELYTVECPHATAGRLEADLRGRGIDITDTEYGAAVTFTVAVRPGGLDELQAMLAALSQGEISAREAGSAWVEVGSGS